jgi:hypothetical protein
MFLAAEKNFPLGSFSATNTGMTHLKQQQSQEHLRVVRYRIAQHILVEESTLMGHNAPCFRAYQRHPTRLLLLLTLMQGA